MRPLAGLLSLALAASPLLAAETNEAAAGAAYEQVQGQASGKGDLKGGSAVGGRFGLKGPPVDMQAAPGAKPRIGADVAEVGDKRIVNRSGELARSGMRWGAAAGAVVGGIVGGVVSVGNPVGIAVGTAVGAGAGAAVGGFVGWVWGKSSYNRQVNDAVYEQKQSLGQQAFGNPFPRK